MVGAVWAGVKVSPAGTRFHMGNAQSRDVKSRDKLISLVRRFASTLTPQGFQFAEETLRFQGSQCHYSRMANILYRQESGPM